MSPGYISGMDASETTVLSRPPVTRFQAIYCKNTRRQSPSQIRIGRPLSGAVANDMLSEGPLVKRTILTLAMMALLIAFRQASADQLRSMIPAEAG